MKLRRKTWPSELIEAVRTASGQSATGRDEILAAIQLTDGPWVAGGRAALYLPDDNPQTAMDDPAGADQGTDGISSKGDGKRGKAEPLSVRRVGWEQIERAGWNADESVLHVWETTSFGTPLRATDLAVDDPGRFGQLLRERIDASILVQRHVPLVGKKGVRIVGRRNPSQPDAVVSWSFVLDKGLEPERPGLVDQAEAALKAVRDEFGI